MKGRNPFLRVAPGMPELLAVLIAVLLAVPALARGKDEGRRIDYSAIAAEGLPPQRLTIWLPPGYDRGKRRYPVLYMHDGHNLFDLDHSNFNKIWAADKAMLAAMRGGRVEPHIIVGIWAPGPDRFRQYPPRTAMDAMTGGPLLSRAYLEWLAGPLKRWIDNAFRTRPARDDTTIMGSSMGGLMSCYAFLERPAVYGRAGCLSSHWPAADPRAVGPANAELIDLWDGWFATRLGKADGRRLWMDHGTATLDSSYAPYQQAIDARLSASGWKRGRDWESRVYLGAEHDEDAWARRLPEVFTWLLARN